MTYKRCLLHICSYIHNPYVKKCNISRRNKYMLNIMTAHICVCVCVCVLKRSKSGLGRLIIEVSRPHTVDTHTYPVGLPWTGDKLSSHMSLPTQQTANTIDKRLYPEWDSDLRTQQSSGRIHTYKMARLPGLALHVFIFRGCTCQS